MGQLIIPTENKIKGPWFLSNLELEELGDVLEDIDKNLSKAQDNDLEEEARKDLERGYNKDLESSLAMVKAKASSRNIKKVTLISIDQKKLVDESLRGILKDPKLADFKPVELKLEIERGIGNQFIFVIEKNYEDRLTYKAKSSNDESLEEIKYKLENWVEKHQPNKLKQWWANFAAMLGLIGFLFICSPLYLTASRSAKTEVNSNKQIDSLVKVGITKENETKAIELLLKNSLEKATEKDVVLYPSFKVILRLLLIGLFLILIAIFKPKTVIGIGKYRSLLKFYKFYTNFILFTIPAIFILPILINYIKGVLGL